MTATPLGALDDAARRYTTGQITLWVFALIGAVAAALSILRWLSGGS